nr:MAG TPA: hypothetical protein [Caudoviricetes sp.]
MAKARNIATGEITAQGGPYPREVTITGIGFKPDHIALFKFPGGYATGGVVSILDESLCKIDQVGTSSYMFVSGSVNLTFSEDNVTLSIPINYFSGTYRYVAWQE